MPRVVRFYSYSYSYSYSLRTLLNRAAPAFLVLVPVFQVLDMGDVLLNKLLNISAAASPVHKLYSLVHCISTISHPLHLYNCSPSASFRRSLDAMFVCCASVLGKSSGSRRISFFPRSRRPAVASVPACTAMQAGMAATAAVLADKNQELLKPELLHQDRLT